MEKEFYFSRKYAPLFKCETPCRYFIITGGRGSGKSFAIASNACNELVWGNTSQNILYLRQTLVSAAISIIPEFMEKLEILGCRGKVDTTKGEIVNRKTMSRIYFRGIQSSSGSNEANLKSIPNIGTVIVDEAQELVNEAVFDRIDLSLRSKKIRNRVVLSLNPADDTHWIYRRFFRERGIADDFNGIAGDVCYIHTDYTDNAANLSQDFLRLAEDCRKRDFAKYQNLFLGFWRKDNLNALWKKSSMIDPFRVHSVPADLDRIVVAVDPAVTKKETSDLTGIVIAGCKRIRGETHYFVLDDRSLIGSPSEWAHTVVNAYREYEADRIVAEVNQGGDLVEQTIRNIDRRIAYRAVHATRGKILRAEPVSELYERGLVHHVKDLAELENEMCSYCGYDREKSPDRLDALVWALTELSAEGQGSMAVLA